MKPRYKYVEHAPAGTFFERLRELGDYSRRPHPCLADGLWVAPARSGVFYFQRIREQLNGGGLSR